MSFSSEGCSRDPALVENDLARKKEEDCYARAYGFTGFHAVYARVVIFFSRLSVGGGEGREERERECLPYVKSARTRATAE
jgi:hypothetical protein